MNKFCELHYFLYDVCYDFIFITESWLTADIKDSYLTRSADTLSCVMTDSITEVVECVY